MKRVRATVRRQDLVEATVKVIAEHGVKGATTRRIAAEAECPLASLHYVFCSKEELFYAVFEHLFDNNKLLPPSSTAATAPLNDVVRSVLFQSIDWLIANPDFAHAQSELFNWALREKSPVARKSYELALKAYTEFLTMYTHPQVDPELLDSVMRLCVSQVDGLLASWFALDDLGRLRVDTAIAAEAVDAFIRVRMRVLPEAVST